MPFRKYLEEFPGDENSFIAHCSAGEKTGFGSKPIENYCRVLIGPEGDFSDTEIELAMNSGYQAISLGESRLRTETAALYACGVYRSLNL